MQAGGSLGSAARDAGFKDEAAIPAWASAAVADAVAEGIMGGYNDGTFRPAVPANRAELAAIATRALQLGGNGVASVASLPFRDSGEIPAWAGGYVVAAYEADVMRGRSNGRFAPLAQATRAEALVLLLNMLAYQVR